MRKVANNLVFSPSDLITFMDSVYDSWMERCYVEFPNEYEADEQDESAAILQDHGNRHEIAFLEQLREKFDDIVEITGRDESAELATIAAMQAGRAVIYQGVLAAGQFAGRSDFLVRVPGKSKLGDFHYEVWDTKLSKKAKPYFVVQLCCYAEMLEKIQDRCPEHLRVVLGDCTEMEFPTREYIHFYQQLKSSFLEFQSSFSRELPPDDLIVGTYSRWKTMADSLLEQRDDLTRIANIRKAQIQRLKKSGIDTVTKLASADSSQIKSINVSVLETLQEQSRLQLQTVAEEKVAYKLLPPVQGKGLHLLPPGSVNDIFFDMEGYPHIEGGLEYLFGAVERKDENTLQFVDWWAHDREQEKQAFEDFIDYVYTKWTQDPNMHVYHYAPYEVSAVRRLAGRHSTRVEEVDNLLRNEIFVDLYQIVRQAFLVGVPSYSIKHIEHLYRPKRSGAVAKATDSVVFYERWLQQSDGKQWTDSRLLKEIRDYNEADCVSTEQLANWLWSRQLEHGIAYSGKVSEPPGEIEITPASALTQELLSESVHIEDSEEKRVQLLLAHLLEFHKREDRPMWWRRFDRQKRSVDELYDDLDCLAGLKRTSRPPYQVGRSLAREYSYDPDQDTKLDEGDSCLFLHDLSSTRICNLDRKNGLLSIIVSKDGKVLPSEITLLPNEQIHSRTISDSIFETVLDWSEAKILPKALADLLFRREPDIRGLRRGEPVVASAAVTEIVQAIVNMQETSLCIQGPPGCGKTYVATQTIVELLRRGKRVGITSNSHKAIENLLDRVVEQCQASKTPVRAMKVGGTSASRGRPPKRSRFHVEHCRSAGQLFAREDASAYNLVAGTAWCFSHEGAVGAFDYLFVDEAGQVCLANVVGMGRSADNLILLGDQMQLEQPVEGSHPGESGKSSLEYFLQDHATVPEHLGVFLGTTYRMHPDVCAVISDAVYESRIQPHAQTARQVLSFPDPLVAEKIGKSSGLVFVPVAHEGNAQASDEEVERIEELVTELLKCCYTNKDGETKQVSLSDILIVAPYNMQVRKIASKINGAQVASVDKFQGREAPIVILSMCASDGGSSPRGMEFLFSMSRLNVAISRAQTIAFVVGNPNLTKTPCSSLSQMRLLNFFCQIVNVGKSGSNTRGKPQAVSLSV
ncbi:MAG: TM0106 family RecB-like putative nuclease [Candidatus Obscuribacterales bacterium]